MIKLSNREKILKLMILAPRLAKHYAVNWSYIDQEMVGIFYFLNSITRQYPGLIKLQVCGMRPITI